MSYLSIPMCIYIYIIPIELYIAVFIIYNNQSKSLNYIFRRK